MATFENLINFGSQNPPYTPPTGSSEKIHPYALEKFWLPTPGLYLNVKNTNNNYLVCAYNF